MKTLKNRNSYFGARQCSSVANDSNSALTHLARGICIAIIAACLAFAPQASAISFNGNTSGIFVNPTGPSGMVASGVGTNNFKWGLPFLSFASELSFNGASFANIVPDQFFDLGILTYRNGTAYAGSEANSVDLRAILAITSPIGLSQNFDFDFTLVNTPNVASAVDSADSVFLTSFFPTTTFNVSGIDYTLTMGFGSVTGSGFGDMDEFFVHEDASANAKIRGLITAVSPPPSVPDAGSTLGLMAMAIVGVGGLRQYLTCKA